MIALSGLFISCNKSENAPASAAQATAASEDDSTNEVGDEGDDDTAIDPASQSDFANLPKSDALVAEANRELTAMKSSSYTHQTHVDEASGTFDFDCSGFLGYALAHAAPDRWKTLRDATKKRPLAKHFTDFFESLSPTSNNGWLRVSRVEDLRAGDIIAWRKPADVVTKNTGHVLLVRGAPVKDDDEWRVPIFDSTHVRHGRDDSRTPTKSDGLGTGIIVLRVDASGAPTGYRWAPVKKDRPHETSIALGRLAP